MTETVTKALQCPDCGHRHPLDDYAGYRTFRCTKCRRLLKVPKSAAAAAPARDASRPVETAKGEGVGDRKKVPPSQRGDAISEQRRSDRARPATSGVAVPRSVRVIIWMVAIPAGLFPVLIIGRVVGILTVDRAIDIFIGVGFGRFVVPLLVLPVWAAATATLAHVAIEWVAPRRSQGRTAGVGDS